MRRYWETAWISALVGAVAAICLCGVIPAQTYVAVSECFRFSMGELLLSYLPNAFVLFAAVTLILFGLSLTRCGLRGHVVVLTIVLAFLLEVGFLSIGLPSLNGDISLYASTVRRLIDSTILIALVGAGCLFSGLLSRHILPYALAVALFAGSSLLDMRPQRGLNAVTEDAPSVGELKIVSRHDVVRSGYYSPSNNVLILIIDSVTREVASDIFRADPNLAAEFPGFVVYEDNLGMHPSSDTATAGLMTGRYCENSFKVVDFVRSQFSAQSFAADFDKKGYPVFVNVAVSSLGMTNRLREPAGEAVGIRIPQRNVRMDDAFPWSISEVVRFRMMPYALKRKYLKYLLLMWERTDASSAFIHSDKTLWPYLAQQPVDPSAEMTLHVNHSPGGHPPLHFDEFGNWTPILEPNYENYRQQCVYVFRQLAELMRSYRSRGLYDVSTILIMADHGGIRSPSSPTQERLPGTAIPMLMVKPRGGTNPLRMSSISTSHSRIWALATVLCGEDLDEGKIGAILTRTNRLYRAMSGDRLRDWIVDKNGQVSQTVRTFEFADDALSPIEYGKHYEFEMLGVGCVPDYRGSTSVAVHSNGCVRVRLPEGSSRRLNVAIDILIGQGKSAQMTGCSVLKIGGVRHRIEKAQPLQKVHLESEFESDSEWLDIAIDSSQAEFYVILKQLCVTCARQSVSNGGRRK